MRIIIQTEKYFPNHKDAPFLAHIRDGGSPLNFPRDKGRTAAETIELFDRALSMPGALK